MAQHPVLALCDAAEAWNSRTLATLSDLDARIRSTSDDKRLLAPWDHFLRGIKAHVVQEEQVLFPALRALAAGQAPKKDAAFLGHLDEMAQDMGEISTIADALRNAARDAGDLEQSLLDLLDDLEVHAAREQDELFPAARRLAAGAAAAGPSALSASSASPQSSSSARPENAPSRSGLLGRAARRLRGLLR